MSKEDLNIPESNEVTITLSTPLVEKSLPKGDFVRLVYINIKKIYSEEEANNFINAREFRNYQQHNNLVQRGLVNRVLVNKLLVYRADNKIPIVDVIFCLIPDGGAATWMDVFQRVVLPFMVEAKVKL